MGVTVLVIGSPRRWAGAVDRKTASGCGSERWRSVQAGAAAPQPLAGVRISRPTSIPRQGEWALDWRRREGEWFRPHRRFVHTWRDDDVSQTAWIVAPVLEFWHYHPQATASDSPPELTLLLDPGDVSPTTAPVE
jgi:hypothetical protein